VRINRIEASKVMQTFDVGVSWLEWSDLSKAGKNGRRCSRELSRLNSKAYEITVST
jgi:hypothetical protein